MAYAFGQGYTPERLVFESSQFLGFVIPGGELIDGSLMVGELNIIVRWAELAMKGLLQRGLNAVFVGFEFESNIFFPLLTILSYRSL